MSSEDSLLVAFDGNESRPSACSPDELAPTRQWSDTTLGEFISLQRGHDLPECERRSGDVPVMGSFGITGWHDVARASGPGVTVGRSGASFGVVSYCACDYWPLNTCLYATDYRGNDPRFAYYLLKSVDFRRYNSGSAQPSLNRNYIRDMPIRAPSLPEQRRIAATLGALDGKIELNRCMNYTLESIARAIFKSWFVDFDPVRKKMQVGEVGLPPDLAALFPSSLAERENGDVPQGWSPGTLGDVGVRIRSQARPEELESGTPYFGLEHLPRRSIALSDWGVADGVVSAKSRFVAGDLLFGKLRPYFHKVGPAPLDGVCSTDIVVVRPRRPTLGGFVLGHLSSDEFVDYASATSSGTRMPRTNWKDMAAYPVVMPPNDVVEAFEAAVSGLLQRIRNNILESRRLAEARDALLPNLLSGELRSLTKTAPLEAR